MVIKGINLRLDSNKKIWYVIMGAVTVAIVLIVVTIVSLSKTSKTEKITTQQIFSLKNYVAEYEVNVKSNKNSNRYMMKEYYLKKDDNESFRFETQNDAGNNMIYVISNNTLHMKADNQISDYILSNYIVSKENVLSISTFLSFYSKIQNSGTQCFKIENQEYDDKLCYRIICNFDKINSEDKTSELIEEYNNILRDGIAISKLELIVNRNTNMPIEYIIYDKNDTAYIDILFKFFDINAHFEQKLFAF